MIIVLNKRCSKCKQNKPINIFYKNKNKKDGLGNVCKFCNRLQTKEYITRQLKKDPNFEISRNLKINYGISIQQYIKLSTLQKNKCVICKNVETLVLRGKLVKLAVDHCHKTGKIRGLLCSNCNKGLGLFNDDPNILYTASRYVLTYG